MTCNPTGIGRMSAIIEMARRRQSGDLGLLAGLGVYTWTRLGIWIAIGLVIYFLYGRFRSRLRAK